MTENNQSEPFEQLVINNNDEIFNKIKATLNEAREEILIASAWFTDDVLFEILLKKLQDGIKLSLVIGENQENLKLPFEQILKHGGQFIRIKSVGYGIMHQKYCIVDRAYAIHGSYNFTINARNNNHESVIYTTHKPTVDQLVKDFEIIFARATAIKAGVEPVEELSMDKESRANTPESFESLKIKQFETILRTLVEAEVGHFNRQDVYSHGKLRSGSCNGDFNIINSSLDTLYYNFLSDIDITEEKKKMLLVKINEHKEKSNQMADLEAATKQNLTKVSSNTNKEVYTRTIGEINSSVEKNNNKIDSLRNIEIISLKKQISNEEHVIHDLNREFLRPKLKLFEFIPVFIFTIVLFVYLLLFYSSAGYILVYSERDANTAILSGLQLQDASVFDADALTKAFDHGWFGGIFVILFFFIPLCFTQADRVINHKFAAGFLSYGIGLFLIDFLVAILVSKSIQDLKILTNKSSIEWEFRSAFSDLNFYLVFVLGGLALLMFKFTFSKFLQQFEARNPTFQAQQAKFDVEKSHAEIRKFEMQILDTERLIDSLKNEIVDLNTKKDEFKYKLDHLPSTEARELQNHLDEANSLKEHYKFISGLYTNKVENNNPRISIDALKDRINTFLEGWNDYLHSYFSISIAIDKSIKASTEVHNWLDSKIENHQIDTRVTN